MWASPYELLEFRGLYLGLGMPFCCRLTVLRSRSVLVRPEGCFELFVVSHTRVLGSQEWSAVSEAQVSGPCRPASVTVSWPCDLDCCLLGSGRG